MASVFCPADVAPLAYICRTGGKAARASSPRTACSYRRKSMRGASLLSRRAAGPCETVHAAVLAATRCSSSLF